VNRIKQKYSTQAGIDHLHKAGDARYETLQPAAIIDGNQR
jgi:hypothetical protein